MGLLRMVLAFLRDLVGADRCSLALENLALRQQLSVLRRRHPQRLVPGQEDRAFWIVLKRLWSGWRGVLRIVQPATVVRWHRCGFRLFWRWKSGSRGRPRLEPSVRELVRRIASDNPLWGAPRIHGELLKLGFNISQRSVSRLLPQRPRRPRSPGWSTFIRNHIGEVVAVDFFVIVSATFELLYGFVVLSLGRRRILGTAVTRHPTADWAAGVVGSALREGPARWLVRDRDGIYSGEFTTQVEEHGLRELITAPRTPQQNAFAERVIGSIRRECLDHVIVLSSAHAARLLSEYADYYNGARTHLALEKDAPVPRAADSPEAGPRIRGVRHLGGLHHRYFRSAA